MPLSLKGSRLYEDFNGNKFKLITSSIKINYENLHQALRANFQYFDLDLRLELRHRDGSKITSLRNARHNLSMTSFLNLVNSSQSLGVTGFISIKIDFVLTKTLSGFKENYSSENRQMKTLCT